MKFFLRFILIVFIIGALFLVIWYSLQFIPYFFVKKVNLKITNDISEIPSSVITIIEDVKNESMFLIDSDKINEKLKRINIVKEASVIKKWPNTIDVELTIRAADVVIVSYNEDGSIYSLFVYEKNENIKEILKEDFELYKDSGFIIKVHKNFSDFIKNNGINKTLKQILDLTDSLSYTDKVDTSLISRINYDNNVGNSLTGMEIYMDGLSSYLSIRDPINFDSLINALSIVIDNQKEEGHIYNTNELIRYDIYKNAVVKRSKR